jgi:ATP-binding cassette subfamily B protein
MTVSEFAIPKSWDSDRRGPARWIASHAARHKIFIADVFFGAFSNAALAAAVPLLIGRAFDAVAATPPDLRGLGKVAGLLVVSQVVRGVLMLGRNFSSEVIGQRSRPFIPMQASECFLCMNPSSLWPALHRAT